MNAYARMVLSYWEMAASFVTSGVLNQELFFQSGGELLFVWVRVRELIPPMREAYKNPNSFQNLETVAKGFIEWMDARSPEAFAAFAAAPRLRPPWSVPSRGPRWAPSSDRWPASPTGR